MILPPLYGLPPIPKALTGTREQHYRDIFAEIWSFVVRKDIVELFFRVHPKNASLCCAAHLENLLATGWTPDPAEFNN
jgi:hypothetical protein